jgi:hypothetical protein
MLDDTCRHGAAGRHIDLRQPASERKCGCRQLVAVGEPSPAQLAVGRDPRIEQTGGFERFEAAALRSRDRVAKSHQLQRRTRAHAPAIGVACRAAAASYQLASAGCARRRVLFVLLAGFGLRVSETDAARNSRCLLLRDSQALLRRIAALQGDNPIGRAERREIVVGADARARLSKWRSQA